jgi:LmbE family N-acetylglucosaminyl deacetylase
MFKKILSLLFYTLSFFVSTAQAPKSYTSSEILLQLKKLNTVGSVLYIAAHPDDENTRLIAYLANEKCLRTGYLSLTRGDGGQNLIGSEQGIELGVIRTQELLAARRIDGGEQFFTRAYDFGFSKTPKETFEKWNHDSVLADVVWVIRNFRPDIIITRFATDGSGGHGHHTASAILAEEAFDAAADPTKFPEQLKYVEVWKTRRMFHNSTARFFNPNADLSNLLKLDVGVYNPLLGKSYGEIAAESRSMHKSQGFGSAKQRGEALEYFKPIKGDTAGLKDIFDGIDFTWKKRNINLDKTLTHVIQKFDIQMPIKSADELDGIYKNFDKTLQPYHSKMLKDIILASHGLFIEATVKYPNYSLNESIVTNTNRLYRFEKTCNKCQFTSIQKEIKDSSWVDSKNITEHYWLKYKIEHNRFVLDSIALLNTAETKKMVPIGFGIEAGTFIDYSRPIQYKWADPEKGELYRPLVITPPVMINLQQKSIAFANDKMKPVQVIVKAGKDNTQATIKLVLPQGWKAEPTEMNVSISKKGEEQTIQFMITPPSSANEGTMNVIAKIGNEEYTKGIKEIKYDHIPVQTLFPEAEAKLVRLDVKKKPKRIGYIPGAGDEVAPCLTQLGYEVVTLTDDMLSKESLQQYDAIITGVRAYNTNDKLPGFKTKLMEYVSNGGNLIVQYNTNSWAGPLSSDIGPYKFKITRDRVTDENAKVTFELPNHPVLNTPNKITDKDFEGWIQERCIYSASDVDSNYAMPLNMSDPNEKPNKGSLIIAKHGKGNFIYTGLVFFRELPAGVPGAYRLFVNLIELGK